MIENPLDIDSLAANASPKLPDLFARESKRLLAFIRDRIPDWEEAEDVLQDVFFQVSRYGEEGLAPIEDLSAWLFTVARNQITDRYRKQRPVSFSQHSRGSQEEDLSDLHFFDHFPDFSTDPELAYLRQSVLEALEEALEELPGAQREVFIRHELEDQPFKDISAETGISINALISRKRYAVQHLRERMREWYEMLLTYTESS